MTTSFSEASFNLLPSVKQSLGGIRSQQMRKMHKHMGSKTVRERSRAISNRTFGQSLPILRILLCLQRVADCANVVEWKEKCHRNLFSGVLEIIIILEV